MLATDTGLLPEQAWDADDIPEAHMYLGRPIGSAMPLFWAHAEYVKLLRSARDGEVFDLVPEVAERYLGDRKKCKSLEVWKFNRQVEKIEAGHTLRIQATAPFQLHWTQDNWQTIQDTPSSTTALTIYYRVMKPGGKFFFVEHGLSNEPTIQVWQNRLTPIQKAIAGGCHLNRNIKQIFEWECRGVILGSTPNSGATIAAMSFPWGEAKGDGDRGGYHLVWTRDTFNSVTGLMAAGHTDTAVRALTYLVTCQHEDGSFAQNFWLDGEPYWQSMQLDEVAYPILLADALERVDALPVFDVYPMIIRAAGYLIRSGPATQQDRWEEDGGYSPTCGELCAFVPSPVTLLP